MRLHVLTLLLSALVCGSLVGVRAQSLADVARQESERRKAIKDSGKVYTNNDLKEVPRATTPAQPAAPTAAPDGSKDAKETSVESKDANKQAVEKPGAEKEKAAQKDQAYWSARMKALQTAVERDQTYVSALQSRINALTTDFVNRDDPAQRARIAIDREKAAAELERLKKAIVDGKRAIADFEEEARRAAVPPGWLR